MRIRTVLLFLGLWSTLHLYAQFSLGTISDSLNYTSEIFSFSDAQGKQTLKGILSIPKKIRSSTKVVVLVAPPLPIPRDYYGLFSTLADVLSRNGIATLRFDNRAYTDKSYSLEDETITMFDQADDVYQALSTLRKDKRFSHQCIGLLGHSEGGAVASIETARNKDISFLICLSALGEKGVDVAYEQISATLKFVKRDQNIQNELSVWKEFFHIVNEHNSLDSIKMFFRQKGQEYYASVKDKHKEFGKISLYEFCESRIRWCTRPRIMAFIKYDPSLYYSKLVCPVLAIHGKMDGNMDCENNLQGIKSIFIKSGKKNYKILAIDSLEHEYIKAGHKTPIFLKRMSHKQDGVKPEYSIETFEYISKWINTTLK